MQGKRLFHVAAVDELIHFAVGIAGNIAQNAMPERLFVESVDRHDRKKLLHRPAIRQALKQRKIAEVSVGKKAVQALQLFRIIVELLGQFLNLAADHPKDALRPASLLQRQISEAEQIQRRIERLLRVVKTFEKILAAEPAQRFLQIDQRLLDVVGNIG